MTDEEFQQTVRLNEVFMPSASRERRAMFDRQGVAFSQAATGVRFAHYTSADAAIKILRGKRMWMRNAKCMADYSEVVHGYELLRQFFGDERNWNEFLRVVDGVAPGVAQKAFSNFNGWWRHGNLGLNIFVASLTEHDTKENDVGRLSMWRAFGGTSDTRVAIVLKLPASSTATTALNILFGPVVYAKTEDVSAEVRTVMNNIVRESDFLRTVEPDMIERYLFVLLFSGVTGLKHEAFREEREWRAVYCHELFPSKLMAKSVEVVGGVPQHVYKIPLDKEFSSDVASLDVGGIVERVIIGPSPYPWPLYQAFVDVLEQVGVPNAAERVWVSAIPLRP